MDNQPSWNHIVWIFGWALFAVLIWYLAKRREDRHTEMMHKERMMAMEKGLPVSELPVLQTPETHHSETRRAEWRKRDINPRWPLGIGAMLICLGIGVTIALRFSLEDYHNRVWSFGLLPIFLGVGLWLQYWLMKPPKGK
jgi:hypothetical protein